jgi:rhamnosyltransferase
LLGLILNALAIMTITSFVHSFDGLNWVNKNSVIAVIVSFNPDAEFAEALRKISTLVDAIVLVDNASSIRQTYHTPNLHFIQNDTNLGLAAAQNQGIKKALALGAKWLLLLDDDSEPEPDMIANMLAHANDPKIAILAPRVRDKHVGSFHKFVVPKYGVFFRRVMVNVGQVRTDVLSAIASGQLIRAELFEKIGFMRDAFFIDQIDNDFCLRVKCAGYNIAIVGDAVLNHSLGAKQEHQVMGKTITTSNHAAFRRYFMYRNRTTLWFEYWLRIPAFVHYDMLAVCYDLFRIICFEENKLEKLKAIALGALRIKAYVQ